MSVEIIIKYIICVVGLGITLYNFMLIKKRTKRSRTTNSLEFCCIIQIIISFMAIFSLATDTYEFHRYFDYISLEIIILSLCIQIMVWLSWFKVFRMQFAHIFTDKLYAVLNYTSITLYVITAFVTFVSFFFDNGKVYGIKRTYVISMLVLWFSLVELVISISTFILNYQKHKSWVKLREQQLQKLASINPMPYNSPTPLKMMYDEGISGSKTGPLTEDITKSTLKSENSIADINEDKQSKVSKASSESVAINVNSGSQTQLGGSKLDLQKSFRASNENLRQKGASGSMHSLAGSLSKKSCLSYENIDKTILHYMHDKSVDFANSDPRATENNIKLISILHILIYILHAVLSILILVVLLADWKFYLHLLLLYTQVEITIKLQDHFLLRQFIDLSLT